MSLQTITSTLGTGLRWITNAAIILGYLAGGAFASAIAAGAIAIGTHGADVVTTTTWCLGAGLLAGLLFGIRRCTQRRPAA